MKQKAFINRRTISRILIIVILSIIAFYLGFVINKPDDSESTADKVQKQESLNVQTETKPEITKESDRTDTEPIFDTEEINKQETLISKINQTRKDKYGLDNSIDIIVREDEILKIGKTTVKMKKILEKIKIAKGGLIEENLVQNPETESNPNLQTAGKDTSGTVSEAPPKTLPTKKNQQAIVAEPLDSMEASSGSTGILPITDNKQDIPPNDISKELPAVYEYGIYIVRSGDNIWNIHFQLLKDYFRKKGINLSPKSDEPFDQGFSSGIGKLLKFSENMVSIYNLVDDSIETDINIIEPMSKVVIYNMTDVFSLLELIDYSTVNQIKFDGDSIWILTEDTE